MKLYVCDSMKYLQFQDSWSHFLCSFLIWPKGYVHAITTFIKRVGDKAR